MALSATLSQCTVCLGVIVGFAAVDVSKHMSN